MSRIGKKPVIIPEGVTVNIDGSLITVNGPKGNLSQKISADLKVELEENQIAVTNRFQEKKSARSMHGSLRMILANMIQGVTAGFTKTLKIIGTGYRVKLEGNKLIFSLGFSHPVEIEAPEGIQFEVDGNDVFKVNGIDKVLVGQIAAKIRGFRPPEPYKGKGIRYQDETPRRKAGKAGKAGAGAGGGIAK